MQLIELYEMCFAAYRQGNLDGGDPMEHGEVPAEIEETIKRSFDAWWKINGPGTRLNKRPVR